MKSFSFPFHESFGYIAMELLSLIFTWNSIFVHDVWVWDKIESNKLNVKSKDEIERGIVEWETGQEKSVCKLWLLSTSGGLRSYEFNVSNAKNQRKSSAFNVKGKLIWLCVCIRLRRCKDVSVYLFRYFLKICWFNVELFVFSLQIVIAYLLVNLDWFAQVLNSSSTLWNYVCRNVRSFSIYIGLTHIVL